MKGLFHEHRDPTDYIFYYEINSSGTTDRASGLCNLSEFYLLWGKAYVDDETGIKLSVHYEMDTLGVLSREIKLETPWGDDTTISATWPPTENIRIEIDQVTLDVAANCDLAFAFDELRLYVGGVLAHTIAAQTVTDDDYDRKLNLWVCENSPQFHEAQPECIGSVVPAVCVAACDTFDEHEDLIHWEFDGGWTYDEGAGPLEDAVDWDPISLPGACACFTGQPVSVQGITSNTIHFESDYIDKIVKVESGVLVTDCADYIDCEITTTQFISPITVGAIPETSELFEHRRQIDQRCDAVTDSDDTTTTELKTYGILSTDGFASIETVSHCRSIVDIKPCPPDGTYPPPLEANTGCCFTLDVISTWLDTPPCGFPVTNISYDVGLDNEHRRAFVSDGTAWEGRADDGLVWVDADTGHLAEWVCIRIAKRSRSQSIVLLTQDAGSVIRYESTGGSFTLSRTVATGIMPCLVISRANVQFSYFIDAGAVMVEEADADDNIIEGPQAVTGVPAVDEVGLAAFERVTAAGEWQMVLQVVIAGVLTQYTSEDGLAFS
jgi:hypothetical protein